MSILLDLSRLALAGNVVLLVALGAVWVQSFRRTRAQYPLALLVVAGLLFVQNLVWGYLYLFDDAYVGWFQDVGGELQLALFSLCGLETLALAGLGWITLR